MTIRLVIGAALLLTAWGVPARADSPLHPEIVLLDAQGEPVLESGGPVSAMRTCAECHDTRYIEQHSYHTWLGFDERTATGSVPTGRPWDFSPGAFGRWNPFSLRRLTVPGDGAFDLGVADWIRDFGWRHVGGGPAAVGAKGKPLGAPDGLLRERHVLDPATGGSVPWAWSRSGTVEMNCFLCHVRTPADDRRVEALRAGQFRWASTATLANTGLVERDGREGWRYVRDRFTPEGEADRATLGLGDPRPAHCGACHLDATDDARPIGWGGTWTPRDPTAAGQVFSAQRVSDSALNLRDKDAQTRPWDVHAERLLSCTDCHHSLNNPVRFTEAERSRPRHLVYDARRLEIGDYLRAPNHHFTKGTPAAGHAKRDLDGSMRRCEGCHDAAGTHDSWLPHTRRHLQTLSCEACHVPHVMTPAVLQTDWTLLTPQGEAIVHHRGIDGALDDPASLIHGYEPALLARQDADGRLRYGPHNLATTWYWVGGSPERPVRLHDLEQALLSGEGGYHSDVVEALDRDRDGHLGVEEQRLETADQIDRIAARLKAVGVTNPRVVGSVEPASIHHGVATGSFATKACTACHAEDSRLTRRFELAAYAPYGAEAELAPGVAVRWGGEVERDGDGRLWYRPDVKTTAHYVLGSDRAGWIDTIGFGLLLATLLGVLAHALLRVVHTRRREGNA